MTLSLHICINAEKQAPKSKTTLAPPKNTLREEMGPFFLLIFFEAALSQKKIV